MKVWNRVEQFFKRKCLRFLEIILDRGELSPDEINYQTIKKVLIIRQHDQLGDLLLSSPVFRALRERFPKTHISLLVREYTADAVIYNEYLDEIITYYKIGYHWTPRRVIEFVRKLRAGFDLAVVLNTVSHSFTSDLFAYLSKAPYVLGSEHLKFPGCQRNFFYNVVAPYSIEEKHQTERNLDILRPLGIVTLHKNEVMTLTATEIEEAKGNLQENGITYGNLVIGIHPGAGKSENRWHLSNFARVANYFHDHYDAKILVIWGPTEEDLGRELVQELTFEPTIIMDSRLRKIAAIISQLDLFLCNDTGIMHVAAAVATPLVAIFGPTDPNQWKPIGDKFVTVKSPDAKCDSVTVGEVIEKMEKMLGLPCKTP